jgi:hypothetical protein
MALTNNIQVFNIPSKRSEPDSDSEFGPQPAKRSRLGDVTQTFSSIELLTAEKKDLIAHILVLQKHVAKLKETVKSDPKTTQIPSSSPLTADQLDEKVKLTRKMMISGLKSQMKVTLWNLSLENHSHTLFSGNLLARLARQNSATRLLFQRQLSSAIFSMSLPISRRNNCKWLSKSSITRWRERKLVLLLDIVT